jgi:hypothetical protein
MVVCRRVRIRKMLFLFKFGLITIRSAGNHSSFDIRQQ